MRFHHHLLVLTALAIQYSAASQHISAFTSVLPGAQTHQFKLPSTTHTFQYLIEYTDPLTLGGTCPDKHDFTGYTPIAGSSTQGYVSINSEATPGAVTVLDVHFDATMRKWIVDQSGGVDFTNTEGTRVNCSGGITPWGTVLTCEEDRSSASTNAAGYYRYGYCVEINPATRTVVNYPAGLPNADKVWKMGYGNHENACVRPDQHRVLYTGLDQSDGYVFKFVADQVGDLSAGKLYVLKKLTATTGQWKRIENTTVADVNGTLTQSVAVGGQTYNGVEDVEIGPDGKVYFAVKNENAVYRFADTDPLCLTDSSITAFETYVGGAGTNYNIVTATGVVSTAWGTGNDNLAFDDLGNLWVMQDGGNNHIWVVEAGHTQAVPKVKVFGTAPAGAEPTGITFTPDYKYLFMSVQHPDAANAANQNDAFSVARQFNKSVSIVLARREFIGTESATVHLIKTFIQGYMSGNQMRPVLQISGISGASATQADTVTVSLHQATAPFTKVHCYKGVLNTNGTMQALFPASAYTIPWYLVITGRNILETWSDTPVTLTAPSEYAFTSAYGNNLGMSGTIPVIYSGNIDPNQDANIDLLDYPVWEAAYNTFTSGYHLADLNGDGNVDLIDYPIWEANYNRFTSVAKP